MSDESTRSLNIAAVQYSLENLALEVYVAGCHPPHCKGCHNNDLWSFDAGAPVGDWVDLLRTYASAYSGEINMVHNVWILGGEPLDQHHGELLSLLMFLRNLFKGSKVWLFTRREYDDVPDVIRRQCHYIKTGPYKSELPSVDIEVHGNKLTLGSSNQAVHTVFQRFN